MAQLGRGVRIGQSVCRLLALALEAIDSTRAGASGSLLSAATDPLKMRVSPSTGQFENFEVVIARRILNASANLLSQRP